MKFSRLSIIITLLLSACVFGQDSTAENIKAEMPENPFATESVDDAVEGEDEVLTEDVNNPFTASEGESAEAEEYGDEAGGIDILLNLGVGVNVSRFDIKPAYITTKVKPGFLFNLGMIIPFARWFYGGVSLRYMQHTLDLSHTFNTIGEVSVITVTEETNEIMSFVSAQCKVGMRFELGAFTPYFYGDIEPAYLTAAGQYISKETKAVYFNDMEIILSESEDRNTTDYRERHQIFIGGGIGFDLSYGYGAVYLDGSCQVGLLETDEGNDIKKSRPPRTSSKVIYFPISLGIRFYL